MTCQAGRYRRRRRAVAGGAGHPRGRDAEAAVVLWCLDARLSRSLHWWSGPPHCGDHLSQAIERRFPARMPTTRRDRRKVDPDRTVCPLGSARPALDSNRFEDGGGEGRLSERRPIVHGFPRNNVVDGCGTRGAVLWSYMTVFHGRMVIAWRLMGTAPALTGEELWLRRGAASG